MTHPIVSGFQKELQAALNAVRRAAIVCRNVQSAITTESLAKKDDSPVTVADFASQAIICRSLMDHFPDDPVIGEEGASELREPAGQHFLEQVTAECARVDMPGSPEEICDWIDRGALQEFRPRFWTLDPIDGTKGFLRKEQYAISLALIIDGIIEVGILGCPNLSVQPEDSDAPAGVLAWAVKGQGAWLQALDQPNSAPTQIHTTSTIQSRDARFCESVETGHSSHDWSGLIAQNLNISREPYRIDSQCKYLAVARGDADLYLRLPTKKGYREKIWDHAGGILIVQEAGGRVTDIYGRDPEFCHGATLAKNAGMVVTNAHLHAEVINSVKKFMPPELA
jgi:3'(2'), 5'-bisphosphate nucleotidase